MKGIKKSLSALLFFCLVISISQTWAYPVAKTIVNYNDVNRSNRSVTAEIFYPATGTALNSPVLTGSWPIVVFGHGFVMATTEYDFYYDSLAKAGYIVVMATTEGGFSPNHAQFAADLSFLIAKLFQEGNTMGSLFYQKVKKRACVMGHSMGGGASFLASEKDTNITTMINFAAANTNPSAIAIASKISVPALVYSASKDNVAPASSHQLPLFDSLSSGYKAFVSIKDGSHCNFGKASALSNCVVGESTVCFACSFVNKAVQQELMFKGTLPWLNYFLKEDCAAFSQFRNFLNTDTRITKIEKGNLPLVNASLSGTASKACQGDSIRLSVTSLMQPACAIQWYRNGVKLNTTDTFLMATDSGNYQVNVLNAQSNGKYSNIFTLSFFPKSEVLFSEKNPFVRCRQINTNIKVLNTFKTYQWRLNTTLLSNSSDSISIDTNGLYQIFVKDSNNCVSSASLQVLAANNVAPQISANKYVLCPTDSILLTAANINVKNMFIFRNGFLFDSSLGNYSRKISTIGSFKARSVDANGCIDSSNSVALTQGLFRKHTIDSLPNGKLSSSIDTNIQWIYNGSEVIVGANSKLHTPLKTGYYQVANKLDNDCTVKSDSLFVLIKQNNQINKVPKIVGCYQNGNYLIFESTLGNSATIFIHDAMGRLMQSHQIQHEYAIDVHDYHGVYLVQVIAAGYLEQFKVYFP